MVIRDGSTDGTTLTFRSVFGVTGPARRGQLQKCIHFVIDIYHADDLSSWKLDVRVSPRLRAHSSLTLCLFVLFRR